MRRISNFIKPGWGYIFLLFALACTTDDDSAQPGNEAESCLLSKVIIADSDSVLYQYNNQKQLTRADFTADNTTSENYYKAYEYNSLGKVAKVVFGLKSGGQLSYETYEYDSNKLLKKITYYNRAQPTGEYTHQLNKSLEYNTAKQLIKVNTYQPDQPESAQRYAVYTYNAAGNVTKTTEYLNTAAGSVNDYTVEYSYDNQINPYGNATHLGIGAEVLSKNNILQEKEIYPLSGQSRIINRTYQYNTTGLPVKETRTTGNSNLQVVYNYTCGQ